MKTLFPWKVLLQMSELYNPNLGKAKFYNVYME